MCPPMLASGCFPIFADLSSMLKSHAFAIVFAAAMACHAVQAAPIYKCTIDGALSYQRDPCPPAEKSASPTVQQLNAERQRKLREAAKAASAASASAADAQGQSNPQTARGSTAPGRKQPPAGTAAAEPQAASFKCDSRTHCSQMRSCAEAKFFLANCPGVKMDGDRNGIPCEQQWCNR